MPSPVATDLAQADGPSFGDAAAVSGCRCALCSGQAHLGASWGASLDASPVMAGAAGLAAQGSAPSYVVALLPGNTPKWGAATVGTAATVTYSFMASAPAYLGAEDRTGFAAMTTIQRASVRQALAAWAAVANITFTEVADTGSGGSIRFGTNAQQGASVGYAYYPSTLSPIGGDVLIANDSASNASPTVGSYGYKTLLHEIGHAIGLKHPGNYNAGGGGTEGPYLPSAEDNYQYTLMSYNNHPSLGYAGLATGPALYDIAAIQYLYGANALAHAGNDTYSLNDTANPFSYAIWDAAGSDVIDTGQQTRGVVIDLRAGRFSSVGTNGSGGLAVGNVSIAYGVVIENATGGSGNDALIGNEAANLLAGGAGNDTLTGGGGNDTLDGGAGIDTAVFSGGRSGYDVTRSGATIKVAHRNNGADGTDTLTGVEYAQFADGQVSLRAPLVAAAAVTAVSGAAVAAGSLFTASDPDNAALATYELVDQTAGGGYFTLGGTAQTAGTVISVAASSLSTVAFVGGASTASDQLAVRVHNGVLWSDWTSWTVTSRLRNAAPSVQASRTVTIQEGAAATALGIATPTDADGDALTVTVTGLPGHGTVRRADGTAVSGGTALSVADIAGLTFTPAAGFSGAAGSFAYTVTDGRGGSAQQAVTVSVASLAAQLAGFDALTYLASNIDLIVAFGANLGAARQHFIDNGRFEGRPTGGFDPYSYLALNPDVAATAAAGSERTVALNHYIQYGRLEGRATTGFNALSYLAANRDLVSAFGVDEAAATRHYIQYGRTEGRSTRFDSLAYLAANPDVAQAFGVDEAAALAHYLQYGRNEGRGTGFDAVSYLATNPDLLAAFGSDTAAAERHYIQYGRGEGRGTGFDAASYLAGNPDVASVYGGDAAGATLHYVQYGFREGRSVALAAPSSGLQAALSAGLPSGALAAV